MNREDAYDLLLYGHWTPPIVRRIVESWLDHEHDSHVGNLFLRFDPKTRVVKNAMSAWDYRKYCECLNITPMYPQWSEVRQEEVAPMGENMRQHPIRGWHIPGIIDDTGDWLLRQREHDRSLGRIRRLAIQFQKERADKKRKLKLQKARRKQSRKTRRKRKK